MQDLQAHFRVLAVNLYGYGETSAWNEEATQTIADQAELVLSLVREFPGPVRVLGHSFGGAVPSRAATLLGTRLSHLFLFEPTLFHLLAQNGRLEAYAEAAALRDFIKFHGQREEWSAVAERFVDYWTGDGGWAATPDDRRLAYMQLLRPNLFEWDCRESDRTTIEQFAAITARTMFALSADARRPIREIAQLFAVKCPRCAVVGVAEGGHMAPLTHPHVVTPIIVGLLRKDIESGTKRRPADAAPNYSNRALSFST